MGGLVTEKSGAPGAEQQRPLHSPGLRVRVPAAGDPGGGAVEDADTVDVDLDRPRFRGGVPDVLRDYGAPEYVTP